MGANGFLYLRLDWAFDFGFYLYLTYGVGLKFKWFLIQRLFKSDKNVSFPKKGGQFWVGLPTRYSKQRETCNNRKGRSQRMTGQKMNVWSHRITGPKMKHQNDQPLKAWEIDPKKMKRIREQRAKRKEKTSRSKGTKQRMRTGFYEMRRRVCFAIIRYLIVRGLLGHTK